MGTQTIRGGHSPHILVDMRCGKVKNGGLCYELARENGGLRTNIVHSGTDFLGIRGVSGTRYCENAHALPMMDTSGWHSGWLRAAMNGLNGKKFENVGLRNGKIFKICLATKNGDALDRNIFVICENDMLRNRNLGLKMGVSRTAHT